MTETTTIKPGDVFCESWGYDQTNIDYYEVVSVTKSGKSVRIRPIASEHVESNGFMSERVRPARGAFKGPAKTKRIKVWERGDGSKKFFLNMTSYSVATLVEDEGERTATHYA